MRRFRGIQRLIFRQSFMEKLTLFKRVENDIIVAKPESPPKGKVIRQ